MAWEKRRLIIYGVAAASTLAAAASFSVWQLSRILFSVVRESDYEASKLIASVTACINSDSPGKFHADQTCSSANASCGRGCDRSALAPSHPCKQ